MFSVTALSRQRPLNTRAQAGFLSPKGRLGNIACGSGVQCDGFRVGSVGLLMIAAAQSGVIAPLSIDQLADAPVVAVCRVERVVPGTVLPLARKGDRPGVVRHCTATLRVLRSIPALSSRYISLNEYCAGPNYVMVNGHPVYPNIETGRTYVFPLIAEN